MLDGSSRSFMAVIQLFQHPVVDPSSRQCSRSGRDDESGVPEIAPIDRRRRHLANIKTNGVVDRGHTFARNDQVFLKNAGIKEVLDVSAYASPPPRFQRLAEVTLAAIPHGGCRKQQPDIDSNHEPRNPATRL